MPANFSALVMQMCYAFAHHLTSYERIGEGGIALPGSAALMCPLIDVASTTLEALKTTAVERRSNLRLVGTYELIKRAVYDAFKT